MPAKPFHLGWFTNYALDDWTTPFGNGGKSWDGAFYADMVKALERARFDYIMLEDTLLIGEAYGHSREAYLKHGLMAPKGDPAPLAAFLAAHTKHLGIVATLSTISYHPFTLARLCSSIDSITGGRFGWNIVTSGENLAAQNMGMDELPPRSLRYDMADEFVDLCRKLWDSWDADAVIADRDSRTYVDHTKVRQVNFEGKFYKSRGPLNTAPMPQGQPVLVQAGGSPRGRQFAAETADSIIAPSSGVAFIKSYRDDIRKRAAEAGRNPDDIKVLFVVAPILGATPEEAQAKKRGILEAPDYLEKALASISLITDIDFSQFDPDKELPKLTTNGEQGSLDAFAQWGSGKTLRQLAEDQVSRGIDGLVGTPKQVAERMAEVMEEVGGDGFLITKPFTTMLSRGMITDVCDGLVPELQRMGLVRREYRGTTLREVLREF